MTKLRDPLSLDAALAKVAGQVPGDWKALAAIAGKTASTVRSWGDEDRTGDLPVYAAILFDQAYQDAGGEGRPIYDAYSRLLGVAEAERYRDAFCIMAKLAEAVEEIGDAKAALIRAMLPDATEADRHVAQRELIEAIEKMNSLVLMLDAGPETPPVPTQPHNRGPPIV